jgi:predicted N-acetyltransferase YhbS
MDLPGRKMLSGRGMSDLSVTILTERPEDAAAIERLNERTFGPGRFSRTAYRIREQISHRLDLSYTARVGTLLVGSVRLTCVRIGETPALLLGPLTVEPPFRDQGIGQLLMERAMNDARQKGHQLVVLVGDEPYYKRVGFKRVPSGKVKLDGPVDPARMLVAELVEGAAKDLSGIVRPDFEASA